MQAQIQTRSGSVIADVRPMGTPQVASIKPIEEEPVVSDSLDLTSQARPVSMAQRLAGDDFLALLERDALELEELAGII